MIYAFPGIEEPIRQGDIFVNLPRIEISLSKIPVLLEDDQTVEMPWSDIAVSQQPVTAIFSAKPVTSIVISQNCDAARAPDITLCEIKQFYEVEPNCKNTTSPKSWQSQIVQQARKNQKWFYLPVDKDIGFETKMGVDFLSTLRLPRVDLEHYRNFRKGRLNEVAKEHFRERIAEFYRRYPYDEWYSLNQDEFKAYLSDKHNDPSIKAFPWQISPQ